MSLEREVLPNRTEARAHRQQLDGKPDSSQGPRPWDESGCSRVHRARYTVPSPGAYPVNPVGRTQSKPQHGPVR